MMKKKASKLSCLFRRAFVFFCFSVFHLSFSQMTLVGNVSVINIIQDKDSVIYIASGTYIYGFDNVKKIKTTKIPTKKNQAISKPAEVLTKQKSIKKNKQNSDYNFQYIPSQNQEVLIVSSEYKTVFTPNNNDHHSKKITIPGSLYNYDVFHLKQSKIFFQYIDFKLQSSNNYKHRIRPPPSIG